MAVRRLDPTTRIIRQLRSGQVTIPSEFRKQLGIEDDSLLQVTLIDGELRIKPVHIREESAGSPWLRELYDRFTPIRDQAADLSEDEINDAIDAAVKAVRAAGD